MWILTALTTVAVAVVGLRSQKRVSNIPDMVFTVSRILIEQAVLPGRVEWKLGRAFVWGMWLLVTLLVTNAYKGVFKSNYILEPKYNRNWTALLDMVDFTLYFGCSSGLNLEKVPDYSFNCNPYSGQDSYENDQRTVHATAYNCGEADYGFQTRTDRSVQRNHVKIIASERTQQARFYERT